jgi:hypothetical protein
VQEGIAVNMRIWSMLRCRLLLYQGRLADARAEADAVLEMSDELGEGARGYVNHVALYTLATVAAHTGDPAALRAGRSAALSLLSIPESRSSRRRRREDQAFGFADRPHARSPDRGAAASERSSPIL